MQLIFEKSFNGELFLYVKCTTAADQTNFERKIFTHSEYTTEWDSKIDEWLEKGYFKFYHREDLIGSQIVITVFTFTQSLSDELIKEICKYFEGPPFFPGIYIAEYKSSN